MQEAEQSVLLDLQSLSTSIASITPPYKKYVALLTQTGANDPSVEVVENTIGTIVWTTVLNGFNQPYKYIGTLTSAFTANKTFILVSADESTGHPMGYVYRNDVNSISLDFGDHANDHYTNLPIEIRVYS